MMRHWFPAAGGWRRDPLSLLDFLIVWGVVTLGAALYIGTLVGVVVLIFMAIT